MRIGYKVGQIKESWHKAPRFDGNILAVGTSTFPRLSGSYKLCLEDRILADRLRKLHCMPLALRIVKEELLAAATHIASQLRRIRWQRTVVE